MSTVTRLNVDLDPDLYERLRRAAYVEHRPMAEIIRQALVAVLPPVPDGVAR